MRDVATRICREYLSGAWKTISSDEIQVKRIRCVVSATQFASSDLCASFQRRIVELFVLRKLANFQEGLTYGEWVEKDTQGQLPQRPGANALLGSAANLRTNSWRTRIRDHADWVSGFHAAQRAATWTKAPRNLPRRTNRAVHSREYQEATFVRRLTSCW